MKKIFILSLSLISVHVCHASVMFSEIMYDLEGTDTDREWVEVYNDGSDNVDLSTWKFFEGNTNHSMVPVDGNGTLAANTYAIIADKPDNFRVDWPNYTGLLFDSSFSLNNDPGETLSLKDENLVVVDTMTYENTAGAQGDGKSLQKINTVWAPAMPTPGLVNTAGDSGETNPPTIDGGGSTTAISKKVIEPTIPKIQTDIIVPMTVFSRIPFSFKNKTTGYSSEALGYGVWTWSFGDGSMREEKSPASFMYSYEYPGTYVVTLSYKTNQYLLEPDATDRITITVLAPELVISSLLPDGGIVLKNLSSKEIDLSGWKITRGATLFVFPSSTIFLPNKELIISQKHSHLSADIPVMLSNPSDEIISTFPVPTVSKSSSFVPSSPHVSLVSPNKSYAPITLGTGEKKGDTLLASAVVAPVTKKPWKKFIPFIGFGLVSGLGGYVWWRYSQPKKIEDEDDYEIVE